MQLFSPAFKFYFKDRINLAIYTAVATLILGTYLAGYLMLPIKDNAPLHYNVYFGIDLIGHSSRAFLIPTVSLVLTLLNIAVGIMVWRHDRIIGYFVSFGTLAIALVTAAAMGLLINLAR